MNIIFLVNYTFFLQYIIVMNYDVMKFDYKRKSCVSYLGLTIRTQYSNGFSCLPNFLCKNLVKDKLFHECLIAVVSRFRDIRSRYC